ncbi:MAG TPA: dTMP kinase [Gemmataceae bacterium]|nr:dTMP kinase [Gemmataceae bacterium]
MSRGRFFSLDGIDGTGKSTQCRLLAERLRGEGLDVVQCADPGGTAVGVELRDILLHHRGEMAPACEALLFMASRAQLVAEVIRPALDAGRTVVSDRFVLANLVYQGYGGGLDVDQLWDVGRLSTGGVEPDLTLVLDLPLDAALARRGRAPDRMESRARDYQQRVRDGFLSEARRRPDRVRVIDAGAPVEVVHERIYKEVRSVLGSGPRA